MDMLGCSRWNLTGFSWTYIRTDNAYRIFFLVSGTSKFQWTCDSVTCSYKKKNNNLRRWRVFSLRFWKVLSAWAPSSCLIFLHVQISCKSSVSPRFGYNCCLFCSSRKIFFKTCTVTHFFHNRVFVWLHLPKSWWFGSTLPVLCSLFLPSSWYAYYSCLLLESSLKHDTKALRRTHSHQERTKQIFILQNHTPLGEKITTENVFLEDLVLLEAC